MTTTLYRFYDKDDVLLYVGIAGNPGQRFHQHGKDKAWWAQVARSTMEHFPSRDAAAAAEVVAIRNERPTYNVVHNRRTSMSAAGGVWGNRTPPWVKGHMGHLDSYGQSQGGAQWVALHLGCDVSHVPTLMVLGLHAHIADGEASFYESDVRNMERRLESARKAKQAHAQLEAIQNASAGPSQLLTADQIADRWGCSRAHVYNLIKRGMPSVQLGGCRRFRVADCESWLTTNAS